MEETRASAKTDDSARLYNSTIISTFLQLIRAKYSYVNITELLMRTGIEASQVEDEGHWFTQEQVDRFHDTLVRMSGDPNIAREAGRYTASPDTISTIARWALGFIDPANVYKLIGKIGGKYTRADTFEYRKISATEIEIIVTPNKDVHQKRYQCENRIGYMEAIVSAFYSNLPRIIHKECIFNGSDACRYSISWKQSYAEIFKKTRNIVLLPALASLALWFLAQAWLWTAPLAIATISLLVVFSLLTEILEKKEIRSALYNVRMSTEDLLDNANLNYNHVLMINEIGRIVSKHNQVDALLSQVIEILKNRLEYDRGLVMLVNGENKELEYKAAYGYSPKLVGLIENTRFHLDREDSRGVFILCYREKRPFLVNDVGEIRDDLSPRSLEFLSATGSKSFICCPIIYEDECLGVLAVDNIISKRPLRESDKNLIMGIAPEIGISVHNAKMTEDRESQFRSILRVLAASIDARDTLTAGHSGRVTEFAMEICNKMGLPRDQIETIRVAAQLHDYGKIGIKDSILKKNGPLSGRERMEIKTHVIKTKEILDQINFMGIYQQVPEIAAAHHEHMDGSGYPFGLKGDAIPLGSRIIAVADFYEAITAKRHYHEPMSNLDAITTLKEASGNHLDEKVVEAFLEILQDETFRPEQAITGV